MKRPAVYVQDLRFGSLGALRKGLHEDGVPDVWLLHDGTRGTDVNPYIRVRDRNETPAAADIKRILREAARGRLQFRGLVVDVQGAHRLIPIARSDWKYQCFQLPGSDDVYLNTVGTFGIRSASYWWSRAGSALVRLAYYVVGDRAPYWNMLVADDMGIIAAGRGMRPALTILLKRLPQGKDVDSVAICVQKGSVVIFNDGAEVNSVVPVLLLLRLLFTSIRLRLPCLSSGGKASAEHS